MCNPPVFQRRSTCQLNNRNIIRELKSSGFICVISAITRQCGCTICRARELLDALGERSDPELLENLGVRDIDAYIAHRIEGLRRKSIKTLTASLRVFLRHLHGSGRTALDLSLSVTSPVLYAYEGIPSALRSEDVVNVLALTRQDRTNAGRRDYAILMLLATYGLRAGEITTLRLDDIDWRKDALHVRHPSAIPNTRFPTSVLTAASIKVGSPSALNNP